MQCHKQKNSWLNWCDSYFGSAVLYIFFVVVLCGNCEQVPLESRSFCVAYICYHYTFFVICHCFYITNNCVDIVCLCCHLVCCVFIISLTGGWMCVASAAVIALQQGRGLVRRPNRARSIGLDQMGSNAFCPVCLGRRLEIILPCTVYLYSA